MKVGSKGLSLPKAYDLHHFLYHEGPALRFLTLRSESKSSSLHKGQFVPISIFLERCSKSTFYSGPADGLAIYRTD